MNDKLITVSLEDEDGNHQPLVDISMPSRPELDAHQDHVRLRWDLSLRTYRPGTQSISLNLSVDRDQVIEMATILGLNIPNM